MKIDSHKACILCTKVGDYLAIIEICDICKKQVDEINGITLTASDMDGLGWIGNFPVREKRSYEIRICDNCIENIKSYCRSNIKKDNNFVEEFNRNKASDSFLNSCKKAGRLFGKK